MKPIRSFLFLLLALILLLSVHFILEFSGQDGLFTNVTDYTNSWFTTRTILTDKPEGKSGKEYNTSGTPVNDKRKQLWKEDAQMRMFAQIYRLDNDLFNNPLLQDIPLQTLEYDSAQAGKILLRDFFAHLLALRNPLYSQSIARLYFQTEWWNENPDRHRDNFIRILYYGDSPIEDDPITSTLRSLFQNNFGGQGKGIVPVIQPGNYRKDIETEGKWHRVQIKDRSRKGNYGILGGYLGSPPEFAILDNKKQETGRIGFSLSTQNTPSGYWNHVRDSLLYPDTVQNRPQSQPSIFLETIVHSDVRDNDIRVFLGKEELPLVSSLENFGQKRLTFAIPTAESVSESANKVNKANTTGKTKPSDKKTNKDKIDIRMVFGKNHNIYTVSLNDTLGICVDNLSTRGRSAHIFSPNNRRFLTDQINLLGTRLIIYRFGTDALKALQTHPKSKQHHPDSLYKEFRMLMFQELSYLRMQMPGIPVIVVGPLESKPETDILGTIQREVAFQTGCAYWDITSSNLAHFTPQGSQGTQMVGKMLYKAILDAYRSFLLQERKDLMVERALQLQQLHPIKEKKQKRLTFPSIPSSQQ